MGSPAVLGSTEAKLSLRNLTDRVPNSHIQVPLRIIRRPQYVQVEVRMLDLTRLAPSPGPIPLWHVDLRVDHIASDLMDEQVFPRTLHGPTTPVPRVTNSAEVAVMAHGRQAMSALQPQAA